MKTRIFLVGLGLLFPGLTLRAQYVEDALRFSQTAPSGTARFQGFAGVNAALGADISSISGNPAGLGFFRKSEWSIAPGLGFANTRSDYLGTTTSDNKANFNIANIGIVFASPKSDIVGGAWRGGSFGISFNRMNSFQNKFTFGGANNSSSFTDFLADLSYDIQEERLDQGRPYLLVPENQIGFNVPAYVGKAQLGYQAYLTELFRQRDTNNDGQPDFYEYKTGIADQQLTTDQRSTVQTTGAQYQWNLSYGGNVADKFYFGASVGISRIRYGFERPFTETVLESDFPGLIDFTWTDYRDLIGTGVNGTIGAIYRPNDIIRFGASVTTPTYYRFTEEYRSAVDANWNNVRLSDGTILRNINLETVTGNYDYNLTTPFRASAGVAVFAGKHGFVAADVEYVPYNSLAYKGDLSDQNTEISNIYRPATNFKVGGEFRQDIFRVRGGFAYYSDPFDNGFDDLDRSRLGFTAGLGFRLPNFYVDVAATHTRYKSGYTPYVFDPSSNFSGTEPSATIKNAFTNAVVSFGTFF